MVTIRENWLIVSMGILLLLSAIIFAAGRPFAQDMMQATSNAGFVLSKLDIEGIDRTERKQILALLDVDAGMPLMSIDLNALQTRIENLPWIRRASVTRVLPGDIKINVEERVPFALWQRGGKLRLIDQEGIIITRHGLAGFSDLLMIVGNDAPNHIAPLRETLNRAPRLAAEIKTVVRVGERRWDLLFNSGIRVKLPDDSDPVYNSISAWERFVRLEAKHRLLAREVSVIDMRIADRLIIRVTPTGRRMMDGKEWAT